MRPSIDTGDPVINRDRDTQDLRPAPNSSDQADKDTKRFGRRMLGAGITTCVATALAAQTAAIISEQRMFSDRAAELFAILTLVALMTLGAALIAVGGTERILRPMRARQRANDDTLDRLRILIEQGALDQQERYENIQGLVAALPGRVNAVAERLEAVERSLADVPNYGRGVIDGVQMRQDVIAEPDGLPPAN